MSEVERLTGVLTAIAAEARYRQRQGTQHGATWWMQGLMVIEACARDGLTGHGAGTYPATPAVPGGLTALDANTLTDLLIDILSSGEYENVCAQERAANALGMKWDGERWITTGRTVRTPDLAALAEEANDE